MERTLNEFQRGLRADLDQLFRSLSLDLIWTVAGENEGYCHGVAKRGEIQIWLYDDEAEFRYRDFHRLCERQDFETLEQLRMYFFEVVRAETSTMPPSIP